MRRAAPVALGSFGGWAIFIIVMKEGSSMPLTYIQLNPSLWAGQSRLFYTNHGIFISEGQACLVDPGIYPDEIEAIARFVAERGAITQAIILTHSHWDHILGPEHFPGVRIITQLGYLNAIREG